jgi:hypothetical protein
VQKPVVFIHDFARSRNDSDQDFVPDGNFPALFNQGSATMLDFPGDRLLIRHVWGSPGCRPVRCGSGLLCSLAA